jgi:hypothetical protein
MRVLNDYNQHGTTDHNVGLSKNFDELTNVTRSSNPSAQPPEQVRSPDRPFSSVSSSVVPPQTSQTQNRTPSTVKSDN